MFAFRKLVWSLVTGLVFSVCALRAAENSTLRSPERDYSTRIQPVLKQYCLGCHSTEKHKGDLDLEQFTSVNEVMKHPKVWQGVVEQLGLGEMPPKEKPQPTPEQREELVAWAGGVLDQIALTRAGDPGPVVLRRLSNAEYKYTLRDRGRSSPRTPLRAKGS
jgi:hypothetical protein